MSVNSVWSWVLFLIMAIPGTCLGQELHADPDWRLQAQAPEAAAFWIQSEVLDEERRVFVALPPFHGATTRAYPLVLVFDGESVFGPVVASARALAAAGHMPDAVVVGIENTDRLRDLSPPGIPVSGNNGAGRADRFAAFLTDELRPALAAAFRAEGPVTLVGHSSGALFVAYALGKTSDFEAALALDAPMHLEGAAPQVQALLAASTGPTRLVSLEARFGWPTADWRSLVESAQDGSTLTRERVEGETHQSVVWPGSYRGLKLLFAPYSVVDLADGPIQRLAVFEERNTPDPAVPPPLSLLTRVAEDQIGRLDLDAATRTIERLLAAYGTGGPVERLRSELRSAQADGLDGPSLADLQSAPWPDAVAAEILVGEWTGHTTVVDTGDRRPFGLSVRIVDGSPVGDVTFPRGPGHSLEYMAISGTQVHVGYMNRMRPRGMLMYEGVVTGDVFEGSFLLRGVVAQLPGGRSIPAMRFRLERASGPNPAATR